MRTFIYMILTAFVSTGAILAGLNQGTPLLGYGIGLAAWAFFFWGWHRRSQRKAIRKRKPF